MIKAIYVLRISFPIYCLHLDLHLGGSFLLPSPPGPSCKRTLSTLQCKHLHTELIPERSNYKPQLKSNFPPYVPCPSRQPVPEPEPMLGTHSSFFRRETETQIIQAVFLLWFF
ncbi:hypothetical protein GOODEAATRI_011946 [Goodea atripinnis]|uniref:Uncharacterized protein n=1 Tax=Goodea atripinnis TaxID=208336 RepID=A0ABV0P500_9TELE